MTWLYLWAGILALYSTAPSFVAWLGLWPSQQKELEIHSTICVSCAYVIFLVALVTTF